MESSNQVLRQITIVPRVCQIWDSFTLLGNFGVVSLLQLGFHLNVEHRLQLAVRCIDALRTVQTQRVGLGLANFYWLLHGL